MMVLVWNINETLFVQLSQLTSKGVIDIFDDKNRNILSQSFENSNYEKVKLDKGRGSFIVKVSFDHEVHTKQVWI